MKDSLENFSDIEFEYAYNDIYFNLTEGVVPADQRCAYILGGQPGAGKTSFFINNPQTENYIVINGDDYRKFHPNYDRISQYDTQNMPSMTQSFCNAVVERLIKDLSDRGYNMVIESTLRNPKVPINTCNELKQKGYTVTLSVIACDIESSWKSTLQRAEKMAERGEYPRFVSIDTYNDIATKIASNLEMINDMGCFDSITVTNRDGVLLYPNENGLSSSDALRTELNIQNWKVVFEKYHKMFTTDKKNILDKMDFSLDQSTRRKSILQKLEENKEVIAASQTHRCIKIKNIQDNHH